MSPGPRPCHGGTRAVEAHLSRPYEGFDIQSHGELAVLAVREGWLELSVLPMGQPSQP